MSFLLIVMALLMMMFLPMAFAGGATVLPTCKIAKGKDALIINAADLAAWQEKGWKQVAASDSEASEASEGNYTLLDAIKSCRSKAAIEEIVEANGLEVSLDGLSFAQQKEAVLELIGDGEE